MQKNAILLKLRHLISPQFLAIFAISFMLWYLAKLSYSYTTELSVVVFGKNEDIRTSCVVEGIGTKLLSYYIFNGGKLHIELSNVSHKVVHEEGKNQIILNNGSLMNAISMRYSDIKIISVASTDWDQELEEND